MTFRDLYSDIHTQEMCKDLNAKALFRKYSVKSSLKFCKNQKTPVLEPILDKVSGLILRFYLKGTNFRGYLFSRAKNNCILRVLIFTNGCEQKISRVLIFANCKKIKFFTTRSRQKKQYSVSQSLGKSTRF